MSWREYCHASTIRCLFWLLLRSFSKNILEYYIMHVDCAMAVLCMQLEGNLLALSIKRAFPLQQLDKILVCWFWSHKQSSYPAGALMMKESRGCVRAAAPSQSTRTLCCPKCPFTRQAGCHRSTSLACYNLCPAKDVLGQDFPQETVSSVTYCGLKN